MFFGTSQTSTGRLVGMIEVTGLTKTYSGFRAVDEVSFTCQPGRVTGFLGPNGAGKTTTMRVMVGLTAPTAGDVTIGGHHYVDIPNPGRHVGVLLDASAQHPGRTGREALTVAARTIGVPDSRVDEMLALVSLTAKEGKRRVRDYSLGMRQRLGIANALLGNPSVLVLDEPANGLDPAGIHWMRGLLRSFAEQGGTVLLSSHLLHEVEMIADHLILIGRGQIVAQGDRATLLKGAGSVTTHVTSLDDAGLADLLNREGFVTDPRRPGLHVQADPEQVGRVAAAHGVVLTELRSAHTGLEAVFLELTADDAAAPQVAGQPDPRSGMNPERGHR